MSNQNEWGIFDYIRIGIKGMPVNSLGGIDVTYRCNLTCKHCYFHQQEYREELSIERWLSKFNQMKLQGFPFLICGWLGGEPLLRKELVEEGRRYFKSNIVFTNGTIELPYWPDSTFSVSVHGTEKYHYEMTGTEPGTYQRIKKNIDRSDLKVVLSFCATRLNYQCIEDMLREWSRTSVSGIVFEFYTPMKNEGDELWLNWEERDRVVDQLIALRKTYGRFIWITDRMYRLMKSEISSRVTSNCPFPEVGFSLDPTGSIKRPCQLGPMADCSRCGCILPFLSLTLKNRRFLIPEFFSGVTQELSQLLPKAEAAK